jgi:hypothetical protein
MRHYAVHSAEVKARLTRLAPLAQMIGKCERGTT